ncbi:hypothetical protein TrST_g6052 [Triparma strigata]|uniref:Uncharacterized protein n=2 Tax=Triparma strigata TaxID=1606541 RepID=A0A9W7EJZ8_9STRA|nr:hypothetical protein TrST_g6052 [Triparma strigata]
MQSINNSNKWPAASFNGGRSLCSSEALSTCTLQTKTFNPTINGDIFNNEYLTTESYVIPLTVSIYNQRAAQRALHANSSTHTSRLSRPSLTNVVSAVGTSVNFVSSIVRKSFNYVLDPDASDSDSDIDSPPTPSKSSPKISPTTPLYNVHLILLLLSHVERTCPPRVSKTFLASLSSPLLPLLSPSTLLLLESLITTLKLGRWSEGLFIWGCKTITEVDVSIHRISSSIKGVSNLLKICENKKGEYWKKKREGLLKQRCNLERLKFQIMEMEGNVDVLGSLREGCKALKGLNEKVGGVEGVERVREEVEGGREEVEEISKMLGGMEVGGEGGGGEEDDDDIDREIEELERVMKEEQEREEKETEEQETVEPVTNPPIKEITTEQVEEEPAVTREETDNKQVEEDDGKQKVGKGLGPPLRVPLPG